MFDFGLDNAIFFELHHIIKGVPGSSTRKVKKNTICLVTKQNTQELFQGFD